MCQSDNVTCACPDGYFENSSGICCETPTQTVCNVGAIEIDSDGCPNATHRFCEIGDCQNDNVTCACAPCSQENYVLDAVDCSCSCGLTASDCESGAYFDASGCSCKECPTPTNVTCPTWYDKDENGCPIYIEKICQSNEYLNDDCECVCQDGYVEDSSGICVKECDDPFVYNANSDSCECPENLPNKAGIVGPCGALGYHGFTCCPEGLDYSVNGECCAEIDTVQEWGELNEVCEGQNSWFSSYACAKSCSGTWTVNEECCTGEVCYVGYASEPMCMRSDQYCCYIEEYGFNDISDTPCKEEEAESEVSCDYPDCLGEVTGCTPCPDPNMPDACVVGSYKCSDWDNVDNDICVVNCYSGCCVEDGGVDANGCPTYRDKTNEDCEDEKGLGAVLSGCTCEGPRSGECSQDSDCGTCGVCLDLDTPYPYCAKTESYNEENCSGCEKNDDGLYDWISTCKGDQRCVNGGCESCIQEVIDECREKTYCGPNADGSDRIEECEGVKKRDSCTGEEWCDIDASSCCLG